MQNTSNQEPPVPTPLRNRRPARDASPKTSPRRNTPAPQGGQPAAGAAAGTAAGAANDGAASSGSRRSSPLSASALLAAVSRATPQGLSRRFRPPEQIKQNAQGDEALKKPLPPSAANQNQPQQRQGCSRGLLLLAIFLAGLLSAAALALLAPHPEDSAAARPAPSPQSAPPPAPPRPDLSESLAAALRPDRPGAFWGMLDSLLGAKHEHETEMVAAGQSVPEEHTQVFSRLKGLAEAAARSGAEQDLRQAVLDIAVAAEALPEIFREHLREAAAKAAGEAAGGGGGFELMGNISEPLRLEVNFSGTSPGISHNSALHQVLLNLGALTGLPPLVRRASLFRSRPASVVVGAGGPVPGDCFAFEGDATIALKVSDGNADAVSDAIIRSIVIEQPARWQVPRPATAPRHFVVRGLPASTSSATATSASPTAEGSRDGEAAPSDSTSSLSSSSAPPPSPGPQTAEVAEVAEAFEYRLAAPSEQRFVLGKPLAAAAGLRVDFVGGGWGESYTCVYRIRAYGS